MNTRFPLPVVCAVALLLVPLPSLAASTNTVIPTGQTIAKLKGKEPIAVDSATFQENSSQYLVTQGNVSLRFPLKEVEYVRPPQPKGFRQATNDIPKLEGMIKTYRRLWWDAEAFKFLMPLYVQAGEAAKAVALYEDMRKTMTLPMPDTLQRNYWDALRSSNLFDKLDREVDEAIRTGSRELVATAYIVRGDVFATQNKRVEALVDGYLKTIVMFEDIKSIRTEALEKAIKTMEALGDPRVERLRGMLREEAAAAHLSPKVEAP